MVKSLGGAGVPKTESKHQSDGGANMLLLLLGVLRRGSWFDISLFVGLFVCRGVPEWLDSHPP
jgi:hypothetical protein